MALVWRGGGAARFEEPAPGGMGKKWVRWAGGCQHVYVVGDVWQGKELTSIRSRG